MLIKELFIAGSSSSSGSSFKPTETPSLQRSRKHIADTFLSLLGEAEVLRTLKPTFEWSATSKASKSLALISLARIVKAGCSVIAPGKEAEVVHLHKTKIAMQPFRSDSNVYFMIELGYHKAYVADMGRAERQRAC